MNSRQIVHAALAGEETPRVPVGPLAVHVTAALAGRTIEDYTLDPGIMVDCICRYHERFQPDAVWLSATPGSPPKRWEPRFGSRAKTSRWPGPANP